MILELSERFRRYPSWINLGVHFSVNRTLSIVDQFIVHFSVKKFINEVLNGVLNEVIGK